MFLISLARKNVGNIFKKKKKNVYMTLYAKSLPGLMVL